MALVRRQQQQNSTGPVSSWGLAGVPGESSLLGEFDRLFNELASPSYSHSQWANGYPIDLYETGEALILNMAVPGIDVDDLDISVEGRELTIKGSLPQPTSEDRRYWLQTIPYGEFRRSINLPTQVDLDTVSANVQNGMLTLTLPKAEQARARRITIQNG